MAASFDESFDYLRLLGLDPATVAVRDPEEIREAVKRRKREWTAQAINPLYQQQARANLERCRQFEPILDDPAAMQAYLDFQTALRAEQRERHEREVSELASLAAGPGGQTITSAQRELLVRAAEERDIPTEVVDAVLQMRQLRVRDDDEAQAAAAGLPYRQPALDRALVAQIHGHLRLLDKGSFYELLDLPANSSPAKIVSTAKILYDRWSKALPKTSQCVAWEKSLQACLSYLKDDEGKSRYDRALFNRRLDEFLGRVDLVLAGGKLTRDGHVLLARLGVEEFGLSNGSVQQSILHRAAARGMPLSKPVQVTVQTDGQTRCTRCFRYTPANAGRCTHCGSSLDRVCLNPACGRPFAARAKRCDHCGLSAGRGRQYVELLRLAQTLLDRGAYRAALDACRLARQILPSSDVEKLVQRAGQMRSLSTTIRRAAADRQWLRVERELRELLSVAPHFAQPGFPELEQVGRYLAQLRRRIDQISSGDQEAEAAACLEVLAQWTDCEEIIQRLYDLAVQLESAGQFDAALPAVSRLAALKPLDEELQAQSVRVAHKAAEARDAAERRAEALASFRKAFSSQRLYAAERALTVLSELSAVDDVAPEATSLRQSLAALRAEIDDIRRAAESGADRNRTMARYFSLLERCHDCREALSALQSFDPAPPAPPVEVTISVHGNRRILSWKLPAGTGPDVRCRVERSLTRPGTNRREMPWSTVFEGSGLHFTDDEVLHAGTVVRYSVATLRQGTISIEGSVLREFNVASPPVAAKPILVWHEVLGLRFARKNDSVELTWHPPAGARQILVERWPCGLDERPAQPALLCPQASGRLIDDNPLSAKATYRVWCIYDGPEGDFVTLGTMITVAPRSSAEDGASGGSESAPQDISAAAESQYREIVDTAPVATHDAEPKEANPLKRMGLWPPVRSK